MLIIALPRCPLLGRLIDKILGGVLLFYKIRRRYAPEAATPRHQAAALTFRAIAELGSYPAGSPDYDPAAVLSLKAALDLLAPGLGSAVLGLPGSRPTAAVDTTQGSVSVGAIDAPRGRAAALCFVALTTLGEYPEASPDYHLGAVRHLRAALDRLAPGLAPADLGDPAKTTAPPGVGPVRIRTEDGRVLIKRQGPLSEAAYAAFRQALADGGAASAGDFTYQIAPQALPRLVEQLRAAGIVVQEAA